MILSLPDNQFGHVTVFLAPFYEHLRLVNGHKLIRVPMDYEYGRLIGVHEVNRGNFPTEFDPVLLRIRARSESGLEPGQPAAADDFLAWLTVIEKISRREETANALNFTT